MIMTALPGRMLSWLEWRMEEVTFGFGRPSVALVSSAWDSWDPWARIGICARPSRLSSFLYKANKHSSALIRLSLGRRQDRRGHLGFQLRSYSSDDPVFCIGATLVNRDCLFRRQS